MYKATGALRQEFPADWSDELSAQGEKLLVEAEQIYGERDRAWTFSLALNGARKTSLGPLISRGSFHSPQPVN
jgi:hypothetical protein